MFSPSLREQRDHELAQVVTSAARTTSSQTSAIQVGRTPETVSLFINVTASSGTSPVLVVHLDTSPDGGTTWYSVANTANITATGQTRLGASVYNATAVGPIYRVRWVISGTTPSFTFTVDSLVTAS